MDRKIPNRPCVYEIFLIITFAQEISFNLFSFQLGIIKIDKLRGLGFYIQA